jgi:phosphoserine phosphatase
MSSSIAFQIGRSGDLSFGRSVHAAVFDLDGTMMLNTGVRFLLEHPVEGLWGPFNVPSLAQYIFDKKGLFERLERARQRPNYQQLFEEYGRLSLAHHIYPRSAQEWAWKRANLHTMVIITGAFAAFTPPFMKSLCPDHLIQNTDFWPQEVRNKPKLLEKLFSDAGLSPHSVYTDSYRDRLMIEAPGFDFDWKERYAMNSGWRMSQLARHKKWTILRKNDVRTDLPETVVQYANEVVRSKSPDASYGFYNTWFHRMRDRYVTQRFLTLKHRSDWKRIDDQEKKKLRNFLAVSGLYLKEPEEVRTRLLRRHKAESDQLCHHLYAKLIELFPESSMPLAELNPHISLL